MKILYALPLLFLAACSRDAISTAQHVQINLNGTTEAYCIVSTPDNRYALRAPGEVLVERDFQDLKIDCKDNLSDRRRTVTVESDLTLNYFEYPSVVTVDFATKSMPHIKNGGRNEVIGQGVTEILTEESYIPPVLDRVEPQIQDYILDAQPTDLIMNDNAARLREIETQAIEALSVEPLAQPVFEKQVPTGRRSYPVE